MCTVCRCNCHAWLYAVLQADSGFFCEGYSSDEDVVLKEEFRGNIIKQGCLLKQVKDRAGEHFSKKLSVSQT